MHAPLYEAEVASGLDGHECDEDVSSPLPALVRWAVVCGAVLAALYRLVPWLPVVPAYAVGVGLRPEHTPQFARRPDPGPVSAPTD